MIALGLSCVATGAIGSDLTPYGLGRVRYGMTVKQAQHALGHKLHSMSKTDDAGCWYTSRTDDGDPDVGYMVTDGRIVRIDIDVSKSHKGYSAPRTTAKVGIGSTEAEVKHAYGKSVKTQPHPYVDDGHYLVVNATDGKRGYIFETDGHRVTSFRAGLYPDLAYIEGCQ